MKLEELLKKFKIKLDLSDKLMNININGEYDNVEEKELILTTIGLVKKEFHTYIFTGNNCKCLVSPSNPVRTVSYYEEKNEKYGYGYSYDKNGNVSSIV